MSSTTNNSTTAPTVPGNRPPDHHTPSSVIVSRMHTAPDPSTIYAAAARIGVNQATTRAAIAALASGTVASVVFSGKMASGKDTVAEEVGRSLARHGISVPIVHRTSDPIRTELDRVISLVTQATSPDEAVTSVHAQMGLSASVSQHLAEALYDETRNERISADARTDLNRHLLQYLADEGRRSIDPDYWIKQFFGRMLATLAQSSSAFLSGGRYPNEILPSQQLGLMTVRLEVSRPVQEGRLTGRDGLAPNYVLLDNPNECALDDFVGFNLVVDNDGDMAPTIEAITNEVLDHVERVRLILTED
jgi:hypothetical protein